MSFTIHTQEPTHPVAPTPDEHKNDYQNALKRKLKLWAEWREDVNNVLAQGGTMEDAPPLESYLVQKDHPTENPKILLAYCAAGDNITPLRKSTFLHYGIPRVKNPPTSPGSPLSPGRHSPASPSPWDPSSPRSPTRGTPRGTPRGTRPTSWGPGKSPPPLMGWEGDGDGDGDEVGDVLRRSGGGERGGERKAAYQLLSVEKRRKSSGAEHADEQRGGGGGGGKPFQTLPGRLGHTHHTHHTHHNLHSHNDNARAFLPGLSTSPPGREQYRYDETRSAILYSSSDPPPDYDTDRPAPTYSEPLADYDDNDDDDGGHGVGRFPHYPHRSVRSRQHSPMRHSTDDLRRSHNSLDTTGGGSGGGGAGGRRYRASQGRLDSYDYDYYQPK